jgi:hypothetical protein
MLPKSLQIVVCISGLAGFMSAAVLAAKSVGFLGGMAVGFAILLPPMWVATKVLDRVKHWPKVYQEWGWLCFCIAASSLSMAALVYVRLSPV